MHVALAQLLCMYAALLLLTDCASVLPRDFTGPGAVLRLKNILFFHKKRLIGVADIGKSVNDDIYNTYILRD